VLPTGTVVLAGSNTLFFTETCFDVLPVEGLLLGPDP
jgi:hypothetical protein